MALTVQHLYEDLIAQGLFCSAHPEKALEYGSPEAPVTAIAVTWRATQDVLKEARTLGCTLLITMRPTFYPERSAVARALNAHKRAWLKEAKMCLWHCGEAWEHFPRIGLCESFGNFLHLGEALPSEPPYALYALPAITAWEVAFRVGRRIADLGGQAVQFIGSRPKMVRCAALTLGEGFDLDRLAALGAEVLIVPDTAFHYQDDLACLEEGLPTVIVPGQVAAIPGLRTLAGHLQTRWGIKTHVIGAPCAYEIWAAEYFRDTHLHLRRDRLDDLSSVTLPEGYTLRPMEADEVWAYLWVMNASNYAGEADEAWFDRAYRRDPEYDPHFLWIIWKGAEPVAAAGSWHITIEGERWGAVEWVGVAEAERGKGLGRAIVLAALHGIRARGMERAMLTTQVWRMPAIATYLGLGFRPWPNEYASQEVWERVLRDLAAWKESQRRH